MNRRCEVKESDYEAPLDKECGIMFVLETEEEVHRLVAAYGGAARGGGWLLNHRPPRSNRTRFQNDGI